jgi:hypothetical protein
MMSTKAHFADGSELPAISSGLQFRLISHGNGQSNSETRV